MDKLFLSQKADYIREEVIKVAVSNQAGHIAPSLSCVDILVALYYHSLSYDFRNPLAEDRDRLILSKAHGCYALYAILADKGILPRPEWKNLCLKQGGISGCVEKKLEYGLEAGCGSLGHGLPIGAGVAFGASIQRKSYYTFCLVGDGEMQEGAMWEALQFAVKHRLEKLIVIIDRNHLQAMDFIHNILDHRNDDLVRRLKGFGLAPVKCPGHNVVKLAKCIQRAKSAILNRPKVIIAETVKGFGLKCMENVPKFHYRIPTPEDLAMGKTYEQPK